MDEIRPRGFLAEILISISLVGWVLISIVAILVDRSQDRHATVIVLASIFPIFAAFIGSALAFHYSSANFAAAINAYRRLAAPFVGPGDTPVTLVRKLVTVNDECDEFGHGRRGTCRRVYRGN